jgi:hypothetical protein
MAFHLTTLCEDYIPTLSSCTVVDGVNAEGQPHRMMHLRHTMIAYGECNVAFLLPVPIPKDTDMASHQRANRYPHSVDNIAALLKHTTDPVEIRRLQQNYTDAMSSTVAINMMLDNMLYHSKAASLLARTVPDYDTKQQLDKLVVGHGYPSCRVQVTKPCPGNHTPAHVEPLPSEYNPTIAQCLSYTGYRVLWGSTPQDALNQLAQLQLQSQLPHIQLVPDDELAARLAAMQEIVAATPALNAPHVRVVYPLLYHCGSHASVCGTILEMPGFYNPQYDYATTTANLVQQRSAEDAQLDSVGDGSADDTLVYFPSAIHTHSASPRTHYNGYALLTYVPAPNVQSVQNIIAKVRAALEEMQTSAATSSHGMCTTAAAFQLQTKYDPGTDEDDVEALSHGWTDVSLPCSTSGACINFLEIDRDTGHTRYAPVRDAYHLAEEVKARIIAHHQQQSNSTDTVSSILDMIGTTQTIDIEAMTALMNTIASNTSSSSTTQSPPIVSASAPHCFEGIVTSAQDSNTINLTIAPNMVQYMPLYEKSVAHELDYVQYSRLKRFSSVLTKGPEQALHMLRVTLPKAWAHPLATTTLRTNVPARGSIYTIPIASSAVDNRSVAFWINNPWMQCLPKLVRETVHTTYDELVRADPTLASTEPSEEEDRAKRQAADQEIEARLRQSSWDDVFPLIQEHQQENSYENYQRKKEAHTIAKEQYKISVLRQYQDNIVASFYRVIDSTLPDRYGLLVDLSPLSEQNRLDTVCL